MILNLTTLTYELKNDNFVVVGLYALKSADRILFLDMVGTFFVFKKIIPKCRSPPTINLDFKNLNW